MASIAAKLVRAAAVASRACPAAVVVSGSSRDMALRLYPIPWRRMCSGVFPDNYKVERDDPKQSSEAAAGVTTIHPAISPSEKNTSEKDGGPSSRCSEEETPVPVRTRRRRKTKDPSKNLDVDARSLESDEALWALYEYWCKYHGRERTRAEMKRRFKWFRRTAERVHKANSGGGRAICTLTHFADLRPMEMPMNYVMSRRTIPRRLLRN